MSTTSDIAGEIAKHSSSVNWTDLVNPAVRIVSRSEVNAISPNVFVVNAEARPICIHRKIGQIDRRLMIEIAWVKASIAADIQDFADGQPDGAGLAASVEVLWRTNFDNSTNRHMDAGAFVYQLLCAKI